MNIDNWMSCEEVSNITEHTYSSVYTFRANNKDSDFVSKRSSLGC